MNRTLPCSRLLAVLCVLVHVFLHSLPAASVLHLGQAQTLVELQQLALLLWDLGTTVLRPCIPSPNMATNTLLGVSPTLLRLGPSHMSCGTLHSGLATSLDNLDRTRTNCLVRRFTNAHDGKTDICFIVSDLKLETISNQNMISFPHPRALDHVSLSRVSLVPPSSRL